jgi:hypothetical protein
LEGQLDQKGIEISDLNVKSMGVKDVKEESPVMSAKKECSECLVKD